MFTIYRLTDGQRDGFEIVTHDDPQVRLDIIAWHLDQAKQRGQTIEIVPA